MHSFIKIYFSLTFYNILMVNITWRLLTKKNILNYLSFDKSNEAFLHYTCLFLIRSTKGTIIYEIQDNKLFFLILVKTLYVIIWNGWNIKYETFQRAFSSENKGSFNNLFLIVLFHLFNTLGLPICNKITWTN